MLDGHMIECDNVGMDNHTIGQINIHFASMGSDTLDSHVIGKIKIYLPAWVVMH